MGTGTDGSSHLKRPHTEDDETELEQKVRPPKKWAWDGEKPGQKILKSIPLQKNKSTPKKKPSMKELTASWNRRARVGLTSETAQGWLKKTEWKRNDQNCLL